MVLFAKITPNKIEATCFAFLTGTFNFCNGFISPLIGTKINDLFFGVSSEDMSDFYKLVAVSLILCPLPFYFLSMIPTREEIKKLQEEREITDKSNI